MKICMKGNYYFIHYAHHQDSASQYDLAFLRKNYLSLIFQDKKRLLAVFLFFFFLRFLKFVLYQMILNLPFFF